MAYNSKAEAIGDPELEQAEFMKLLMPKVSQLQMDTKKYLGRGVNQDMSGGEKKRNEVLQMLLLRPDLTILDEIDSGLDMEALKVVSDAINDFVANKRNRGEMPPALLIITHYRKLLQYVKPDFVHIML